MPPLHAQEEEKKINTFKNITLSYIRCCFLLLRDICGPGCRGRRPVYNEGSTSGFLLYTHIGQYLVIFIVINLSKSVRVFLLLFLFIFFLFFFYFGFISLFLSGTRITPVLTPFRLAFCRSSCL